MLGVFYVLPLGVRAIFAIKSPVSNRGKDLKTTAFVVVVKKTKGSHFRKMQKLSETPCKTGEVKNLLPQKMKENVFTLKRSG